MRWFGKETRRFERNWRVPSGTRFFTVGTGEGGVLVGIWYAERMASPAAPRDLKAVIRRSGSTRGSVSSHRELIRKEERGVIRQN